MQVFF